MCGIMNGLALHSKIVPYGGTFLIFSDYCKPSIRLSAMMKKQVIYYSLFLIILATLFIFSVEKYFEYIKG